MINGADWRRWSRAGPMASLTSSATGAPSSPLAAVAGDVIPAPDENYRITSQNVASSRARQSHKQLLNNG